VTALFLGSFVLGRGAGRPLNRVFLLLSLAIAYRVFGEFGLRQAATPSSASLWLRMGVLWTLGIPLGLDFCLIFTEQCESRRGWRMRVPLYGSALALSLLQLTGEGAVEPVRVYWGWTYGPPRSWIAGGLINLWVLGLTLLSLLLCLRYALAAKQQTRKKQAWLVLAGFSVASAMGFTSELLPHLLGYAFPELTGVGVVLECALIGYAVWRHDLFDLELATAAEGILFSMIDLLLVVDADGRIVRANRAASRLLGYEADVLAGRPVETFFAPVERATYRTSWFARLEAEGAISDVEVSFEKADESIIPVSLTGSVMQDSSGLAQGVVYVGRDLSERRETEKRILASLREKEVLLREIHHRVKNNLQVICSLFNLQSESITDAKSLTVLRESRDRVRSMALIHERLYQSSDLARIDSEGYIRDLVTGLLRSSRICLSTISLSVDVGRVSLDLDTAIPCGLILNELVSNALKHAFPDERGGRVRVSFHPDGVGKHVLTVSDDGVGLPEDVDLANPRTLGLQLVHTLVQQLGGTIDCGGERGTSIRIVF
jgi:PAS domain S-box-containing protein